MKILITGNLGYVGPVLVRHLRLRYPDAVLLGFDSGYFAHCLTGAEVLPETLVDVQHFGDVRNLPEKLLEDVDSVVHLAAVSNDPMGNRFEKVTEDINYLSSARIARVARDRGVKHFVFASSCSMYGAAEGGPKRECDDLNPLTAYARSKAATEAALRDMDHGEMVITALRFATACGMSPRLRLDLVVNDFVACALSTGVVSVLSDGTPWRPLIHVDDMALAIDWAINRHPEEGGSFLAVNTGSTQWNHQVRDLAHAVAASIGGTKVKIDTAAPPDKRSYRVDFSLFSELAPEHQPRVTLRVAIEGLRDGLLRMGFCDAAFRTSQFMRLKVLDKHITEQRLSDDLRWAQRM